MPLINAGTETLRLMSRRTLLMGAAAVTYGAGSWAQNQQPAYPTKTIRYIVPVAAGGGADMIARAMCERLGRLLGQNLVVDNISGGGGVIACQAAARSTPDGYTLIQSFVATHGTSPATRKLPFDALKDFSYIGMIGTAPNVLCVHPSLPVQDVKSFVAYVRQRPGQLAYGSAGAGSLTHLVGELFKQQTELFMTHIPYRGVAPANMDVMSGQTQALFPSLAGALPHIRSGKMRALAVTGLNRHPMIKDIPTFEELGFKGFDGQQWYGVMGPAGMPTALITQLNETLHKVLTQPDFKDKLASEAVQLWSMSPEAFKDYVRLDIERWSRLAKSRNIVLDS
jgi:tripartite-type tricarboxylate transporter receptor subunit TctC